MPTPATTTTRKPVIAGLAVLLALVLGGAYLISVYVDNERQRDLDNWAIRLGLVAETRVNAIEHWLDGRVSALNELANNASLQLYLWQLAGRDEQDHSVEPAQLSYLRNLVLASASRNGFLPEAQQPQIPANLPQRYDAGLALLDARGRHVVSTKGMPEIGAAFQAAIKKALKTGQAAFSTLVTDAHERVLLGIAVPVPRVIGSQAADAYSGVVLAVVNAERSLYPLLQAGVPTMTSEVSLLISQSGQQVVYLSPTVDGGVPTRKTLPMDRDRLAAAAALRRPGAFGEYLNYQGHEVLATSRKLRSTPWLVLQEVEAGRALSESDRHRQFLITTFSLLLFFFVAILVAAWRHGSSVRARHDADSLRQKTLELEKQTELLHAVTDNADAYVLLLDAQQRVLFANAPLADKLGAGAQELVGNSLAGVLGPANVEPLTEALAGVEAAPAIRRCSVTMALGTQTRSLQCSLVPVDRIGERYHAILLVLHDTTELEQAQRKHAALMRKLVDTLMHVVDLHDPNSAHHSARVAEVANAIGRELRLSAADRRTLDLAASLANLGKIFVPREVLTKTEPLTEAEQALVQRHVLFGTELLADLEFEGPVVDTIAQKHEHPDGSGYPDGLREGDILLTARILAVSNAFVALLSPRAYRGPVGLHEALEQLLRESPAKYDRQVVAALFHVAENRADWSQWVQ